jgi:hypothetical protein
MDHVSRSQWSCLHCQTILKSLSTYIHTYIGSIKKTDTSGKQTNEYNEVVSGLTGYHPVHLQRHLPEPKKQTPRHSKQLQIQRQRHCELRCEWKPCVWKQQQR